MSGQIVSMGTLSIAAGQTDSAALLATRDFREADSISIFAPAVLPETVTLQGAPNESPAAGDWMTVSRGGADVSVPAGKVVTIELPSFKALRLHAGGAVAAQRDFPMNKGFDLGN